MATTSPMEKAPNEILLDIAAYLDTKDLLQLALVSKKLQPVAQDVLFRCVDITRICYPEIHMLRLLRTLLDRPDLIAKVTTLQVDHCNHGVSLRSVYWYEDIAQDLDAINPKILPIMQQNSRPHVKHWTKALDDAIDSAYLASLLVLLPNLRFLQTGVEYSPDHHETLIQLLKSWDDISHHFMFNNIKHLTTGLRGLDSLLPACNNLVELELRGIWLGTLSRYISSSREHSLTLPGLNSLTIKVKFSFDDQQAQWLEGLSKLPSALRSSNLRHLTLTLPDTNSWEIDLLCPDLSIDWFLAMVHHVWPEIHSFHIEKAVAPPQDDDSVVWFDFTLRPFENLKHLSLPIQPFFTPDHWGSRVSDDKDQVDLSLTSLLDTLPRTLETMQIVDHLYVWPEPNEPAKQLSGEVEFLAREFDKRGMNLVLDTTCNGPQRRKFKKL